MTWCFDWMGTDVERFRGSSKVLCQLMPLLKMAKTQEQIFSEKIVISILDMLSLRFQEYGDIQFYAQ